MQTTRRDWIAALCAAGLLPAVEGQAAAAESAPSEIEELAVKRHDSGVESVLARQVTGPSSANAGAVPDSYGLYWAGTATGICNMFAAAFHHPRSRFHRNPLLLERMRLAAGFLARNTTPEGNIHLPVTNFNSPPDTAFGTLAIAEAASIARKRGGRETEQILQPFLDNARRALLTGGVHTPNHRWVVCAALAMIDSLDPDPRLVKRIDQWLAEGIDIDEDGQFDERSILTYNVITDRALITIAHKGNRPALLDPVRRNLDAAFYLMHPDGEMVTEISHRQDRDTRGDIGAYWFPMHYMAQRDRNPRYAWVARRYAASRAGLSLLMDYPELLQPLPPSEEPPAGYEKEFRALEIARIRRGGRSATLLLRGDSRFFMLRHGDAVIPAVRFASAFFGKGQFVPRQWSKQDKGYLLRQSLSGPYFQPLDPPHRVKAGEWDEMRPERQRSEVCFLEQSAFVTEAPSGFAVTMQAAGTDKVPVAIEVNVRGTDGIQMDGLVRAPDVTDGFLLAAGHATIRSGSHAIRFGPGRQAHQYTQVRGAEPKLPGGSIYITGMTPFRHTIEFECL